MKSKIVLPPEVKSFFISCGAKGGSSKSPRKMESSRKNGKLGGRPKGSTTKRLKGGNGLKTLNE